MGIVFWYAVACGVVGFPWLMVIEIILVYHLSVVHRIPFKRGELAVIWAVLMLASFILALVVEAVSARLPGPGWAVEGVIAFGFVMGVGGLVDSYYATEQRKLGST